MGSGGIPLIAEGTMHLCGRNKKGLTGDNMTLAQISSVYVRTHLCPCCCLLLLKSPPPPSTYTWAPNLISALSSNVVPGRPFSARASCWGSSPLRSQVLPGHARSYNGTCLSVSSFGSKKKKKARCICLYISETAASEERCPCLLSQ